MTYALRSNQVHSNVKGWSKSLMLLLELLLVEGMLMSHWKY